MPVTGGATQRWRWATIASSECDDEAAGHRHEGQLDVAPERVDVVAEVVLDPAGADLVLADARRRALADLDLGEDRGHADSRSSIREMSATDRTPVTSPLPLTTGPSSAPCSRSFASASRSESSASTVTAAPFSRRAAPAAGRVVHALQRQALERAVGADEVLDEVVRRRHEQVGGGGVLGEDAALLEHRDAVAHLDRLVDVVGDEEDGLAQLCLQAQELVLQAVAVDGVDRAEGLVHEHQRGVAGEGARDADALALPAGELGRVARAHRALEPDEVHAARRRAPRCGPCSSPAAGGRSRCSRRSSGAGTARSAGSRSRSHGAARRRRAR